MNFKRYIFTVFCIIFALTISAKDFIVVLDPGHGGKDPGAVGKIGQEKDINLNVAIQVGDLIKKKYPEIKVIYTRETDKYVTLQARPNIANNANGDLFISIHTNASESTKAYGAETFTLGLSKSQANFEVAKRENSVLLLEEGNKETYQGFDPTSPESYIMFEFMQSKYVDQSVEIAYYIQKEFTEIKRLDRGVRQAIFWVLHQVKMPSILVELGFITNPSEEKFLLSKEGQTKLANCIFNAFEKYKHEYDKRTITTPQIEEQKSTQKTRKKSNNTQTTDKKETTKQENTTVKKGDKRELVYKIQVFSSRTPIAKNHYDYNRAKKFSTVSHYTENNWYKYTCYNVNTRAEAEQKLLQIKNTFKDAMIIAFYKDKKITLEEAAIIENSSTNNTTTKKTTEEKDIKETTPITYSIQVFSSRTLISNDNYDMRRAKQYGQIKHFTENGWYKYACGEFNSYEQAKAKLTEISEIFKDAIIVAFKGNKKISIDTTTATDKNRNDSIQEINTNNDYATFFVQVFSSKTPIPNDNYDLKRAKKYGKVIYYTENGWYKYICAETESYETIKEKLIEIRQTFKDAVIVAFKNNKKISIKEALNKTK